MIALGTTGLQVSPLCLGGNVFGWTADDATTLRLLDAYVDGGGNFIDTADSYSAWADGNQGGDSETVIGRWLARRGRRDDVVIATKVGMWSQAPGLSASNIATAVDGSLRRLGVDCIDLFYAHIDDTDVPLVETLGALGEQVAAGKIAHLGASNYTAGRLAEALAVSREHGLPEYAALQVHYNFVHRHEYEDELAALCGQETIACLAYSALADGFLTGKYRRSQTLPDGPRREDVDPYLTADHDLALQALDSVAERHGVPVSTVALAWLNTKPGVIALASARTPAQLEDLMRVLDLVLSDDDVAELDAATAGLTDAVTEG
jgi:aryl-alcohol dehydrogenase-like predicted oxidoreductase